MAPLDGWAKKQFIQRAVIAATILTDTVSAGPTGPLIRSGVFIANSTRAATRSRSGGAE
jgi:hypothetical protein